MTQGNIIVALFGDLHVGHGATEQEARLMGGNDAEIQCAPASPEVAKLIREGRDPSPLEIVGGVARCEA